MEKQENRINDILQMAFGLTAEQGESMERFVKKEIAVEREALLKELVEEVDGMQEIGTSERKRYYQGYNQALSEVLRLLKAYDY